MYGFNSANRLVALLTGAAPYAKIRHSSRRSLAGITQLVDRSKFERKMEKKLKKLSSNVVMLTCQSSANTGICNVYLVGSNHACRTSWAEVKAVAEFLKPENHVDNAGYCCAPTMREMVDMWKENYQPTWILYKWLIRKRYIRGAPTSGGEFVAANEEAKKYGAKVILGDRPLDITLQRYRARTSLRKAHAWNFEGTYKGRCFCSDPAYVETFIHERDLYMSAKILEIAREHQSVVAVVGKFHLPGIQKNWNKPVDTEQLLEIPTGKRKVVSIAAGAAVIYGIYLFMKS